MGDGHLTAPPPAVYQVIVHLETFFGCGLPLAATKSS